MKGLDEDSIRFLHENGLLGKLLRTEPKEKEKPLGKGAASTGVANMQPEVFRAAHGRKRTPKSYMKQHGGDQDDGEISDQ